MHVELCGDHLGHAELANNIITSKYAQNNHTCLRQPACIGCNV